MDLRKDRNRFSALQLNCDKAKCTLVFSSHKGFQEVHCYVLAEGNKYKTGKNAPGECYVHCWHFLWSAVLAGQMTNVEIWYKDHQLIFFWDDPNFHFLPSALIFFSLEKQLCRLPSCQHLCLSTFHFAARLSLPPKTNLPLVFSIVSFLIYSGVSVLSCISLFLL